MIKKTLRRVIEERFIHAGSLKLRGEEIWQNFFCPTFDGRPTPNAIVDAVLPKPRDLIYLIKSALALAVNRKHAKIEEDDILEAYRQYSRYALDVLLVETSVRIDKLEEMIYELLGEPRIITRQTLRKAAQVAGVTATLEEVIEALVEATFLGVEVAPDKFIYRYEESDKRKLEAMSRKTTPEIDQARLEINVPFRSYLEIGD